MVNFTETGLVAKNKKAYHDYTIIEEYEAGIVLEGSEVKSLRLNGCKITDTHAEIRFNKKAKEEVWLLNLHISEYKFANKFNHKPMRDRKLLLTKKEIHRLFGKAEKKGLTIIPLSIYFNDKGLAKVKLGLCQGKTKYDKRETLKNKDWQRQKQRAMKEGSY